MRIRVLRWTNVGVDQWEMYRKLKTGNDVCEHMVQFCWSKGLVSISEPWQFFCFIFTKVFDSL